MMNTREISANTKVLYFIALIVVMVVFLELGGGAWFKGIIHGNGSSGIAGLNWVEILVSLAIGICIGWALSRRN